MTTRLCLDRLRSRTPAPTDELDDLAAGTVPDPAEDVALAETVGVALHAVLDRLTPRERVAFVLHDSFAVDFPTVASILGTTPAAARQLASRARAKVRRPVPERRVEDHEVVDAFMAAARGGDLGALLRLLAPDVVVEGDAAAVLAGTPARMDGAGTVAGFFDGSAHAALPVLVGERPGYAWYHRGEAKVIFDFTVTDGLVARIDFRAAPEVLRATTRRPLGGQP